MWDGPKDIFGIHVIGGRRYERKEDMDRLLCIGAHRSGVGSLDWCAERISLSRKMYMKETHEVWCTCKVLRMLGRRF